MIEKGHSSPPTFQCKTPNRGRLLNARRQTQNAQPATQNAQARTGSGQAPQPSTPNAQRYHVSSFRLDRCLRRRGSVYPVSRAPWNSCRRHDGKQLGRRSGRCVPRRKGDGPIPTAVRSGATPRASLCASVLPVGRPDRTAEPVRIGRPVFEVVAGAGDAGSIGGTGFCQPGWRSGDEPSRSIFERIDGGPAASCVEGTDVRIGAEPVGRSERRRRVEGRRQPVGRTGPGAEQSAGGVGTRFGRSFIAE